jgi:hypothetical protein
MPAKKSAAIEEHFAEVTDPRRREGIYPLINFLVIAVCAVICGADDFVAIAEFGRAKKKFLEKFLDLSAGIPSQDGFNAIFRALKPAEFEKCLLSWITALHEVIDGQVVAVDGKTLRRFDASSSKAFTVFELARFLCVRDLPNALKSLDTLFRNGEDTPMMIGALSRHFRQLWRVREMIDRKAAKPDIAREAGINPYFLDDMITQARNFARKDLRNIFNELYRCDLASKTGGGQPYTLMHGLVTGICSS